MSVSTQSVSAGRFEQAYSRELEHLRAIDAVKKLYSREPCLWKSDPAHRKLIANRLGWLSVLDPMRQEAAALSDLTREMNAAGLRDIVLLGTGGACRVAEVFSQLFRAPARRGRFCVLDSTDPASILEVEKQIDLPRTLFLVVSKSGKTIETLSLFFYFHDRVEQAGVRPPGDHFMAITDRASYLDELANEYSFRRVYRSPEDIGSRYSALSYSGLVPAALWDVDDAAVLDAGIEMRAACGPETPAEANPALALSALIGAAAKSGAGTLILLLTPKLAQFGNWVEQLIAESTGKEGQGVVPLTGGVGPRFSAIPAGCVNVVMSLECEDDRPLQATVLGLKRADIPVVDVRLAAPAEIGGEFFKWEAATALVAAGLAIDPFDEPNVQESKDNTRRILDKFQATGEMSFGSPRVSDSQIEIYAEGELRSAIGTMPPSGALRTFFGGSRPDDYLALLCYVARNAANGAELDALRILLIERLGLPVLLGYGPQYLHATGQLYKGGPASGMFLMITEEKSQDVPIPGAKYSFGQLQMAQALGDLEAIAKRGKPALHVHLTRGAETGLAELRKVAGHALQGIRTVAS